MELLRDNRPRPGYCCYDTALAEVANRLQLHLIELHGPEVSQEPEPVEAPVPASVQHVEWPVEWIVGAGILALGALLLIWVTF